MPPPIPPPLPSGTAEEADDSVGDLPAPKSDFLAEIEAKRKAREERAAKIERGEIQIQDPREARERAMKQKRTSLRPPGGGRGKM